MLRDLTLLLFAAGVLLTPLHYYLGSNHADERFAWRMFSTTRATRCQVQTTGIYPQNKRVAIHPERDLHPAWRKLVKRGWPSVYRELAKHTCQRAPIAALEIQRTCRLPNGRRHTFKPWTWTCGDAS